VPSRECQLVLAIAQLREQLNVPLPSTPISLWLDMGTVRGNLLEIYRGDYGKS
jgi:hypothetical protein